MVYGDSRWFIKLIKYFLTIIGFNIFLYYHVFYSHISSFFLLYS